MSLKNKRILITAGPTWVPVDNVRVISNIATGKTGILLAEKLYNLGASVTLLLGPNQICCLNKGIKLLRFKFFDELRNIVIKELKPRRYDIVIHSAAVSDYRPKVIYKKKVKSGKKYWKINLVPTAKIIDLIKRIDKSIFLVGFKFEPDSNKNRLINQAKILMKNSSADLVVANTIYNDRYNAYILSPTKIKDAIKSRNKLAKALIRELKLNFNDY